MVERSEQRDDLLIGGVIIALRGASKVNLFDVSTEKNLYLS